jgi:hypothetical protein
MKTFILTVLATTLFTISGAHAYDLESLERDRFYQEQARKNAEILNRNY